MKLRINYSYLIESIDLTTFLVELDQSNVINFIWFN